MGNRPIVIYIQDVHPSEKCENILIRNGIRTLNELELRKAELTQVLDLDNDAAAEIHSLLERADKIF